MTHTDFQFSTKAKTLKSLESRLESARIAPLYFFTVQDWNRNKSGCLAKVTSLLGTGPWVVRSSCGQEDTMESANAGALKLF